MSVMDLVYAHKCTNPMVEFVYDIGSYLSEDEMSFLVSKK